VKFLPALFCLAAVAVWSADFPAPTMIDPGVRSCHASTLCECADGSLLVAYFAGTREGADDVAIRMAHVADGKAGPAHVAAKVSGTAHWNPVLWSSDGKSVTLFFKVGKKPSAWRTWVMRSADSGLTWSLPAELVPGDTADGRGPVKNKPVLLADGTLAAPASTEAGKWRAFVDRSRDGGLTWAQGAEMPWTGVIQPTLWESPSGQLHAFLRSDCGAIVRADSRDGGLTWLGAAKTSLPNNNSGIDLVLATDGALYLLHNPVTMNWGPRSPLRLSRSRDNGGTWQTVLDLAAGPGEFSYPAIIQTRNGDLACSFTWKRERIAFVRLPLKALK
jgi:predicted neuraminidase